VIYFVRIAFGLRLVSRVLKVAKENGRFVVQFLERYHSIKGSGLVWKFSGKESAWTRIALGDEGVLLGEGLAKVSGATFTVEAGNVADGNRRFLFILGLKRLGELPRLKSPGCQM